MQQPYSGLAQIYDYLLSGVDYEAWADYLEDIFRTHHIQPCSQLIDLACGTGSSTVPWAKRGYQAYGVDISEEMLEWARRKASLDSLDISFFQQDLREMQLDFLADVAVLYQDGLNYMLTEADLEKALRCIHFAVRPGGFFVFNMNQVEKLPAANKPETAVLEEENLMLIWESHFEPGNKTWVIKLTAFQRKENGFYKKIQEEHRERSYSTEDIVPILKKTGWIIQACYRAFSFESPGSSDRNVFYVLQRGDIT